MSYIILTDSQKRKGEKLALADRSKIKTQWWTQRSELAMVFRTVAAAEAKRRKINFNNPQIWTFEKGSIRLGQVERTVRVSAVELALARKDQEWHDDDWCESSSTGNGLES